MVKETGPGMVARHFFAKTPCDSDGVGTRPYPCRCSSRKPTKPLYRLPSRFGSLHAQVRAGVVTGVPLTLTVKLLGSVAIGPT